MPDDVPPEPLSVEVGSYDRLSQAKERALVVSAMGLPHWIVRDGRSFSLRVETAAEAAVAQELGKFETEQAQRVVAKEAAVSPKIQTLSLYVAAWFLGTAWFLQNVAPATWLDRGEALSSAIVWHGEWWRALTALVLHGDLSHLVANLASGLLFSAFVLPHLGTGLTWLFIVTSGFLGNLINAWFYRASAHASIGASTAVFGALGLLVAIDFVERFSSLATRSRWQLVLPIGAGFALLAYLGVGDTEHSPIDYMAHLWGFLSGLFFGALAGAGKLRERTPLVIQRVAAVLAPTVIAGAWWLAITRSK